MHFVHLQSGEVEDKLAPTSPAARERRRMAPDL